jgi:hypothetical protein
LLHLINSYFNLALGEADFWVPALVASFPFGLGEGEAEALAVGLGVSDGKGEGVTTTSGEGVGTGWEVTLSLNQIK